MKIHDLKTLPQFFAVVGVDKTFEVRRDDRGFAASDILHLREWSESGGYTGRSRFFRVSYILRGEQWGILRGYAVLGLAPYDPEGKN